MERAARFAHNDTVQVKLDKLGTLLTQSSTPRQDAALLSEMLSLPNDGRYPALELTPHQRRQKTLDALHAQVETFARKSPVLMIFEDVHWADPSSLELFGRGVSRIANLPVLLLITFRPEFKPPWIGQPNVTALRFGLDPRTCIDVINVSTGRSFVSEILFRKQMDNPDFVAGFSVGLFAKDVQQ